MTKLTDLACKNAKCEGKIRKLADGGGLYLWVQPNGSKRWNFRYFINKKEKGLVLGSYPQMSLNEARKEARNNLAILEQGNDPSEERKLSSAKKKYEFGDTFESVALDWFKTMSPKWKSEKHAQDVLRRIKTNLLPRLGTRVMSKIESLEVLDTIKAIQNRGATDLAHRVLGVCSQIFVYGIIHKKCERNVTEGLVTALTPHKAKNQNAINPKDISRLMQDIDNYHETGDYQTEMALKLLAHTFTRTSELIEAKWNEFDFEKRLWIIPAERMKMGIEHHVPLTMSVIRILKNLKKLGSKSDYILPGRTYLKPMSNNTILFALYRLGYKGKMSGHGFRALASTLLNEAGFRSEVIERQLAHIEKNKVRAAYNRAQYLSERKEMMSWWSNLLDIVEKGGEAPTKYDPVL